MTNNNIVQPSQYTVNKLSIVTKLGEFDITGIFEEINIFDSVFNPCMTGNILINDSVGMSNKFSFDGSEVLVVDLGKTKDNAVIQKTFRIYKQSNRKSLNMSSEVYLLHFVSDEFILSQQQKVSQSFTDTYSNIATKIMEQYLNIGSNKRVFMEKSLGIKNVIIPNKTPFDALEWCSKRSANEKGSATFVFFENKLGYNFATLSSMLAQSPVHYINFQPKNLSDSSSEMMGATRYEVVSQFDINKNIKSGVYAGTYIGFDISTRSIAKKVIDYDSVYQNSDHANKTPNIGVFENIAGIKNLEMFNSRKILCPTTAFAKNSEYVKENDPTSLNVEDDTYNYVLQRESGMQSIMGQRLKIVMPGNFDLTSGLTAGLLIPSRSEKSLLQSDLDMSLTGKYLIVATRHIINYNTHQTIIEVVTDTNNRGVVYENTDQQRDSVLAYG